MDGQIGHNNPPDPIDLALEPYANAIELAEGCLSGAPVTTKEQMNAVDALIKDIKAAIKNVTAGQKSATAPLHDAWKKESARWKPTLEDLGRIRDGLVNSVSAFKNAELERVEKERREAFEKAEKLKREAELKQAQADTSDIDAQRDAASVFAAAKEAEMTAKKAPKSISGMRMVPRFEIEDHKAALHWIAQNDRDAVTQFIELYVKQNHQSAQISGVRSWKERVAV